MGHVDYPHMVIHSNCHSCILRDRIIFIGTGNIDISTGYDNYQCIRFSQYRIKGYFPEPIRILNLRYRLIILQNSMKVI